MTPTSAKHGARSINFGVEVRKDRDKVCECEQRLSPHLYPNSPNQPTTPDQVQPAPTSSSSPDTVPTTGSGLVGTGRDWLQVVGKLGLTGLAGGWTCSGMIGAGGEWLGLANRDCVNWNMGLARAMSRAPTESAPRFDRRRVEAAKTFPEDMLDDEGYGPHPNHPGM